MNILKVTLALAVLSLVAVPHDALAQSFGIGPHLSFIRAHTPSNTPATRMFGGTLRLTNQRSLGLEVAIDYKSTRNELGTERVRERPITGSLMIFLTRRLVSPYLLGGMGMYTTTVEALDAEGQVLSSESEREFGTHLGAGLELFFTRHTAFMLDYRYLFVSFGEPEADSTPIGIPGLEDRLSHRGSMWKAGLAFYF